MARTMTFIKNWALTPSEENGKKGFSFAVWAPNAKVVHVVGAFNDWDEEKYPMKKRNDGGIWTLFIPGLPG